MTETIRIPVPAVAPLGIPVDRDSLREVWDCYVKPGQDAGDLQSVEERILMAVLRAVYVGLGPTDREPGEFPDLLTDAEGVAKPPVSANSRSVANDPVAATPCVKPSREDVAREIALGDDPTCPWPDGFTRMEEARAYRQADAVLALLPGRAVEEVKPEGVAVELADCLIRILDTMHSRDVDIDGVVARKMAYNAGRPHKHGKAY